MKPTSITFLTAFAALAALGDTITWTGAAGNLLWDSPGNWSAGALPTPSDTAIVNAGTMDAPIVIGQDVRATPNELKIATAADSTGAVAIDGGELYIDGTHHVYVGDRGNGTLLLNGSFRIPRQLYIGNAEGSFGTFIMTGGTIDMGRDAYVGESGTGIMRLEGGSVTTRAISVGRNASADGSLVLAEGTVYRGVSNPTATIGSAGRGELYMQGGSASPVDTYFRLTVRGSESGFGIVRGWGSWNVGNKAALANNGLVVADGEGQERTLLLQALGGTSSCSNTIENDSTNGWYAVRKGMLDLQHRVNVPVGETGATSWGESADDEVIDLVNSARFTFHNVTGKNGILSLGGKIYAFDRTDAHLEDLGATTRVSVWDFSLTNGGACSTFDLELRYDHVRARGLALTLWRHDGTAWAKVDNAEWLSENRVKASGLEPSGANLGLYAITGMTHTTIVLFR